MDMGDISSIGWIVTLTSVTINLLFGPGDVFNTSLSLPVNTLT